MTNVILNSFPTPDALFQASETELEHALLHQIALVCDDPARRMTTRDSVAVELFETGGYTYDFSKRSEIAKRIDRAWKALDDAGLIEEPDTANGRNGYRVMS